MLRILTRLLWALIAVAAAFAMATIARSRGEPVNSMWLVIAAVCTYLLGYRF
jgi:carbon starvation protein